MKVKTHPMTTHSVSERQRERRLLRLQTAWPARRWVEKRQCASCRRGSRPSSMRVGQ